MNLTRWLARVVELSARHRAAVIAAWAAAALLALAALPRLRLDALPDLSEPQVVVVTEWMGHNPAAIEQEVTYPIVSRLLNTPSVRVVRGQSMPGMSYVYAIFRDGTDLGWARARVLEQLSALAAALPRDVAPGLGPDASGVGWVFQYALRAKAGAGPAGGESQPPPVDELRAYQESTLRHLLAAVPGVAEVATVGGQQRQYDVTLDPNRLRARGVALPDVIRAVRAASTDVDGGGLEIAGRELQVTARAPGRSVQALEALSVRVGDAPVRLRDVADVAVGAVPRRGSADLDGNGEHVGGVVIMRDGENALAVIQRVKQALKEAAVTLPAGVEVVTTYDRSGLIERSLATLRRALVEETLAVVLLVLAFLLHARSALLPALSLPLAVLITLGVFAVTGVPATIMSLGGIAIALGATVDAEIVMLEACHRRLERQPAADERRTALAEAGMEVTPAIVCSLLVIAIAFLPVFALSGQAGRLFAPLAFAKTTVMVVSALMSVTLAPALRDLVLRGRLRPEAENPLARALVALYRPFVYVALKNPRWTLAMGALAFLSAAPLAWTLGEEFMPELDEGDLLYMPTTIASVGPAEAQRHLQAQDRALRAVPEVQRVFGKVGRADSATDPAPLNMIETTVQLRPPSEWRRRDGRPITRAELIATLDDAVSMAGWTGAWTMPIRTRIDMLSTGVRTPVGVKVFGRDLQTIDRVGQALARLVATLPGTKSATFEESLSARSLQVTPDLEALARNGVALADLQAAIEAATGGIAVGRVAQERGRAPVVVRFPAPGRQSLEALGQTPIPAALRSPAAVRGGAGAADGRGPPPGTAAGAAMTDDEGHAVDSLAPAPGRPAPSAARGAFVSLREVARLEETDGPAMVRNEGGLLVGHLYIDVDTATHDLGGYVRAGEAALARWQSSGALTLPVGTLLRWTGQYEALAATRGRMKVVVPLVLLLIALLLYALFRNLVETLIVLLSIPFALVGSLWALALLDYRLSTAVWIGLIAVVGLAAQTGVVMIIYIDQAYERRRAAGLIRTAGDILAAHLEGTLRRVRPKVMTVAAMTLGLVPLLWRDSSGADVMKRIAAPMVGGLISSAFLTLELIPVVYTYWRREQLLWEELLRSAPGRLTVARLRAVARAGGGFVLLAAVVCAAPIYLPLPSETRWLAVLALLAAGVAGHHYARLRRQAAAATQAI